MEPMTALAGAAGKSTLTGSTAAARVVAAVLQELPGMEQEIGQVVQAIHGFAGLVRAGERRPVRGLVVEGPSGTGKTSLARAVARSLGLPWRYVSAPSLFGANRGDAERRLRAVFEDLLILDDLEAIGKDRKRARHVADLGILAALLEALDDAERACVFVVGLTPDSTALDTALLQPGRLETGVRLSTPSVQQRRAILEGLLRRLPLAIAATASSSSSSSRSTSVLLLDNLARRTRGFAGADLAKLCAEALAAAASRSSSSSSSSSSSKSKGQWTYTEAPVVITEEDWEAALEGARPAGIPWAAPAEAQLVDLAGVDDVVRMVSQAVLLPLARPQALAAMGVPRASFGVLLHGPPGTGKSTLGRALATAARPYASFLAIECPELINKVVGESERAVARLFQTARQAAPCILFLDHVEAIVGKRGFDTSSEQTMDRLLSTLLVEMDGVASGPASEAAVVVIATTNHRSALDEAILRPGRLDLHVELPLPNAEARAAILRHHVKALPLRFDDDDEENEPIKNLDSLVGALVAETEGLSGADIQGLCQEAALLSLRESLESDAVRPRHLLQAVGGHFAMDGEDG